MSDLSHQGPSRYTLAQLRGAFAAGKRAQGPTSDRFHWVLPFLGALEALFEIGRDSPLIDRAAAFGYGLAVASTIHALDEYQCNPSDVAAKDFCSHVDLALGLLDDNKDSAIIQLVAGRFSEAAASVRRNHPSMGDGSTATITKIAPARTRRQMVDIYGMPCDVHLVRTFRDGRSLGAGYSLQDSATWYVYDREAGLTGNGVWHMHCGPYSMFDEAKDWIMAIREDGTDVG